VRSAAHTTAGSALIEVLAAMTLFAVAGSIVAAAALTNLRALRTATTLEYLVAVASRELSAAQAKGAPETSDDALITEAGTGIVVQRQLLVTRGANDLATLVVAVAAAGAPTVTVRTRMLVAQ
jgi:hypothetical protein